MTFLAIPYVPNQPRGIDALAASFQASRAQLEKASFPARAAGLIRENAIDPVTQSEIEILARSTESAQSLPAAGIPAVAVAAVFAPAGPCGAGEVDGVRGGVHVCGSDT